MIQYQTLNPFSQLLPGLIAHDQRRSKEPAQPSDAIIADPGQYQPVEIDAVMADVNQDLQKYNEVENKIKSFKVKPERKKQAMENYANSGVFKSPLVQALAKTGRSFEEINTVFTNVKNGSPEAKADIQLLIDSSDGDPKLRAAIQAKMAEYNQLDTQNKQSRVKVLSETLDNINTVQDKMGQYQGKSGIMNPQTKKVVDNEMNYLKELTMLDPKAAEEHFGKIKARAAGGSGALKSFTVMAKNPTSGRIERTPYSASDIMGWKNVPGAVGRTAAPAAAENFVSNVVNKSEVESDEYQKTLDKMPAGNGQVADKATFDKFSKMFGDRVIEALKAKNWKVGK